MMYIDQTACSDLQRTRRLEWLETNGLGGFSSSTIIGLNTRHRPEGPNGIAFSPDERYLCVTNWDEKKKIAMRYEVLPDGTLKNGKLFFDMTNASGDDALDGLKIDRMGNLYVSGPGGLWILSPDGKHLGTIIAPKHPHNMAWGDEDGKTLYMRA